MSHRKKVIILTDGDETAYRALAVACESLPCHPLKASVGNPTPLSGKELVNAVVDVPAEPVVVMVDDRGDVGRGPGEEALNTLLDAEELEVLGVIAVAANSHPVHGVQVDLSVNQYGKVVHQAVDKSGRGESSDTLKGDTVDVLAGYSGPIVGLGDPGKMQGHDAIDQGVPATRRALEEILRRVGLGDARS